MGVLHQRHHRLNHPADHGRLRRNGEELAGNLVGLHPLGKKRRTGPHAAELQAQAGDQLPPLETPAAIQKREAQHRAGIGQQQTAIRR